MMGVPKHTQYFAPCLIGDPFSTSNIWANVVVVVVPSIFTDFKVTEVIKNLLVVTSAQNE